jgi:mRNA interferase MazF
MRRFYHAPRGGTGAGHRQEPPPRGELGLSFAAVSADPAAPARIHRGDVFWIAPDDSRGPAPSYSHPHVIVQDDVFNHSRITTVVVCALTTNLHRASEPGNVLLEVGEGSLPRQSVVVVSQIDAVDKARLGERIGSLSEARVEQILAGLRFQQVSFFRR